MHHQPRPLTSYMNYKYVCKKSFLGENEHVKAFLPTVPFSTSEGKTKGTKKKPWKHDKGNPNKLGQNSFF